MLWHPKTLQNLAMYNVFFIFGRFSIAGKLPKWPKIPFQYPLALRHPKILEKCRKYHRILVSVRNRFWPPPAKADIATAILTNVIEHLVLLLPPNKHAFTAKAVWADFIIFHISSDILMQAGDIVVLCCFNLWFWIYPWIVCSQHVPGSVPKEPQGQPISSWTQQQEEWIPEIGCRRHSPNQSESDIPALSHGIDSYCIWIPICSMVLEYLPTFGPFLGEM